MAFGSDRRRGEYGPAGVQLRAALGSPGKRTLLSVQAKSGEMLPGAVSVQEAARQGVAEAGSSLPHLDQIQASFGHHDVSHVRAHVGGAAATASASIGAQAYATGDDVAFASTPSLHLAAHEAAHTVQQAGGVQLSGGVGQVGDRYEHHADEVADLVVQGKSAERLLDAYAGTGRADAAVQKLADTDETGTPTTHASQISSGTPRVPSWSAAELKTIQHELVRLGLYRHHADGDLNPNTQSGLVEAFASNDWRAMDAATCLGRLKAAKKPKGKRGEHELRMGEMVKDHVIDMTLALGFDENGFNVAGLKNLETALTGSGFIKDAARAQAAYVQAGRAGTGIGDLYIKDSPLMYQAPAAEKPIEVNIVVRLAYSLDGSKGKEVAEAFKEGMAQSDIAYYSGHGRYGTGPDFDRNLTIDLLDADGSVERTIDDYDVAEEVLKVEGKRHGRSAWQQFQFRLGKKTIRVNGSNDGNVLLNTDNPHPGEFGSNLMYWNMTKNGTPPTKQTGAKSPLGDAAEANQNRKYRVVVFDGCRSVDYVKELRKTKGFDAKSADVFGSSRTLDWGDEGKTLAAFLHSIIAMQSAEQIVTNMDKQQSEGRGAYHGYGLGDNPIIK